MKCPDECQVCQVYCFKKNSQIINLMSKISEYCERFSDKNSSRSSKTNKKSGPSKSFDSLSFAHSKNSINNVHFHKKQN